MKDLPLELVTEILLWLPIKPLIRFRCVSKAWLQLLTLDPQFARLHYHRLTQSNKLNPDLDILGWPIDKEDSLWLALGCTSYGDVIGFHLPFDDNDENTYYGLFGIRNGLLAFVHEDYRVDLCLHIWNPLTKDYINVDPPPTPDFQPYLTYGFGYDQSTDEYKVIGVDYFMDPKQGFVLRSQVYVFTLGVDTSWRIVEEDNKYILAFNSTISSLVKGVIHWIAQRPGTTSLEIIVGFDLRDEVFREIEPPSDMNLDDGRNLADIREMGGLLCIFSESPSFLEIWIMKEYGVFDSWTKLLKFDKWETGFIGTSKPIAFAQNGDIILMFKHQTLYSCNPETKATRILAQFDDQIFNPYAYVGSIISPTVISRVGLSLEEVET